MWVFVLLYTSINMLTLNGGLYISSNILGSKVVSPGVNIANTQTMLLIIVISLLRYS